MKCIYNKFDECNKKCDFCGKNEIHEIKNCFSGCIAYSFYKIHYCNECLEILIKYQKYVKVNNYTICKSDLFNMTKYKNNLSLLLCDIKIIDERELKYLKEKLMGLFVSNGIFNENIFMKILAHDKFKREKLRIHIMDKILSEINSKVRVEKYNKRKIEDNINEILKLKNNIK